MHVYFLFSFVHFLSDFHSCDAHFQIPTHLRCIICNKISLCFSTQRLPEEPRQEPVRPPGSGGGSGGILPRHAVGSSHAFVFRPHWSRQLAARCSSLMRTAIFGCTLGRNADRSLFVYSNLLVITFLRCRNSTIVSVINLHFPSSNLPLFSMLHNNHIFS